MNFTLLRKPAVLARHHFKNTSLYQQIADGVFPPPVKVTDVTSAWLEYESDAVLAARIAGCSKDELRALVRKLIADRAKLRNLAAARRGPARCGRTSSSGATLVDSNTVET